uniref:Uncharacterized protein n=1 Tax=Oryza brachyantha TaxID=4533 RepID=J3M8Q1_ORYBR
MVQLCRARGNESVILIHFLYLVWFSMWPLSKIKNQPSEVAIDRLRSHKRNRESWQVISAKDFAFLVHGLAHYSFFTPGQCHPQTDTETRKKKKKKKKNERGKNIQAGVELML